MSKHEAGNNPEHVHLVLYQGVEIIGYARIQFWPKQRAALRIIVIDETIGSMESEVDFYNCANNG